MTILVHYSEIGIKGKNRDMFEHQLMDNIRALLKPELEKVYKRQGKLVCTEKEGADKNEIIKKLKSIPGIAYFCFAENAELSLESMNQAALRVAKQSQEKNSTLRSFKIIAIRSNKEFELNSMELNREVGAFIIQEIGLKADMHNPELSIYVEVSEKEAFVYADAERHESVGGLPVGSSGKVMCSLSGGLDSPVSGYMLMKRGCEVVFVHVLNHTQQGTGVKSKIEDLAAHLSRFQLRSKLYIVPFEKIQQTIIVSVPSQSRMIVYRRFMMRIINELAKKERAMAIVTGDSVGQVASQTLENIGCIQDAANIPVLCPLIGMNKEEIVNIAKKIGTYELSILPYPDCCSFMIAEHPETHARIEMIKRVETGIEGLDGLVADAIARAEVKIFQA